SGWSKKLQIRYNRTPPWQIDIFRNYLRQLKVGRHPCHCCGGDVATIDVGNDTDVHRYSTREYVIFTCITPFYMDTWGGICELSSEPCPGYSTKPWAQAAPTQACLVVQ
ncbi:unnamed protein product, partial [Meganyctiphanes norvegica]